MDLRGRDKPIHGSCAIYFPGGINSFVVDSTVCDVFLTLVWFLLVDFNIGEVFCCLKDLPPRWQGCFDMSAETKIRCHDG